MSRIFPKSQKRQILEIFCKICFPYFARDKWSDHDSENCSEIRPVTRIRNLWRQSQILRKWPKIRAFQGSKSDSAFCKIRLPNFAGDESSNHDFENCSKISSVTWFRICPGLLHFPTFMFFTPPYSTQGHATMKWVSLSLSRWFMARPLALAEFNSLIVGMPCINT
jgi:hypothetical protein